MSKKIAIVGAGLAGSTIAYELASRNPDWVIDVFEQRKHVAGNIHTERDPETCVMLHKYGPHIFHTTDERIWKWFQQFGTMVPYVQRTKGVSRGEVYSLPINLHTMSQYFGRVMTPREAKEYMEKRKLAQFIGADNFEGYARSQIGDELYAAFIEGYTEKQWGISPHDLPASVFKRLPMRFSFNDNAFDHPFQGIPKDGYTKMIWNMLDVPNINVHRGQKMDNSIDRQFDHVFWTGPIDEFYKWTRGDLPYRTLDFEVLHGLGDMQGCSVMNWCDREIPWTRSTEHKHFTPWEEHGPSTLTREHPRQMERGDIPYYPIRLAKEQAQLSEYEAMASKEVKVTFAGRLGTYQYLDMDKTIYHAREIAKRFHLENCRR